MKRVAMILTILAALGLMTVAFAGDYQKSVEKLKAKTAAMTSMDECCVEAATAGKGCCGKDADAVKAKYTEMTAQKKALESMHACCATAVAAGEGCCGKDEPGLKAAFAEKVVAAKAEMVAMAGMHECCATAMSANEGCCGMDAAGVKASYKKAVDEAKASVAAKKVSAAGGCPATTDCATPKCEVKSVATDTKVAVSK